MNLKNYLAELKRRNVIKAALAYLVFSWIIIQVFSILLPTYDAPAYVMKIIIAVLIIGFPLWLIFSWVYEVTTEGIKKTISISPEKSIVADTSNRLNKIIIGGLGVAIVLLVLNMFKSPVESHSETKDVLVASVANDKSIAVLAFADMSPEKDQEYFSDGISEEILNLLAKIPDLKVISRTSSFSYKGKEENIKNIGNELQVGHVLEGSIRKSGDTFRITAQLIDVTNGAHVWSETYDRDMTDIFKIQDEIAAAVTKQLKLTLLGDAITTKAVNPEAYTLYLKALHLAYQNTKAAYISAEEIVKKAIEIEPDYADAWRLLAGIYDTGVYNFDIRTAKEGIPLGLEAANKTVQLDPESGNSYITLASLKMQDWNFEESEKNIRKALELDPNDAVIIGTVANMTFGDLNEAVELLHKSMRLDPLLYVNYYNLGFAYLRLNQLDKAEEAFNSYAIYYPNSQILHYMMARVRLAQGRYDEAIKEIEQETHEFFSLYGKNCIYYKLGKQKEADSLFDVFKKTYGETDPSVMADLYAFRGATDQSFYWLNKAFEIKDPDLLEALTYPTFKSMHKDARWQALINIMGLPENHGYQMK